MPDTLPISPLHRPKGSGRVLELEEEDLRSQLVERIIASPSFAKSERLTTFLSCVCNMAQNGQAGSINEQYIGAVVFGRNPDYDPGADSIVRSHASRLRHRLVQYFAEEGAAEELVLTIPKGGYVPVFEYRDVAERKLLPVGPGINSTLTRRIDEVVPSRTEEPPALASAAKTHIPEVDHKPSPRRSRRLVPLLAGALVAMAVLAATLAGALVFERRHDKPADVSESVPLFWGTLFNANEKTSVAIADSGLVILQNLTKRRITLETYISGDYLKDIPPTVYSREQTLNLGIRRYTSIVDLNIQNRLFRMHGLDLERTQFRYSRDLRMDDMKQGNLVLLGTYESTPWVQLFEPSMNFYFENDLAAGVFSIFNRAPRPGEQARYDSTVSDRLHTVYGLVAYRPTLSGSGKVLILEGQSMAGTEAAADFVFDDGYLLPFLRSIRRPDGSVPYFELLLRSRSISVEASRIEAVASRIESR